MIKPKDIAVIADSVFNDYSVVDRILQNKHWAVLGELFEHYRNNDSGAASCIYDYKENKSIGRAEELVTEFCTYLRIVNCVNKKAPSSDIRDRAYEIVDSAQPRFKKFRELIDSDNDSMRDYVEHYSKNDPPLWKY